MFLKVVGEQNNSKELTKPFSMFVACCIHVLGIEIDPIKLDICDA